MNKHPYNNIIERKLEQLPVADADLLWSDMHSILDKKMPQKKERRRFIMWLFNRNSFLLLILVTFIITGSCIFFLFKNESSVILTKKLPGADQPTKIIDNGVGKISASSKESLMDKNKQTQNPGVFASIPSAVAANDVINNSFITGHTKKQLRQYTGKNKFNLSMPGISGTRTNFSIDPLGLESIHENSLVAINNYAGNDSLSRLPQPLADQLTKTGRHKTERGFYAGILSGVDLSSIHFKSAKTGATAGVIIGYNLSNKWSIESGLLWDRKKVYDNGSYFTPPGYTPTTGIKIVAVNGSSRLYEWPVNMKYTLIQRRHNVFVTAGVSSYFMRSENYDYVYTQNSQPGGHNYLSYKNETKNWFSVVNFSLGYEHKLNNSGSLRIEPYLKLPLKNLGVGNMPIMSTGLNIGYTWRLK